MLNKSLLIMESSTVIPQETFIKHNGNNVPINTIKLSCITQIALDRLPKTKHDKYIPPHKRH